jgi:hypothetical protein
MRRTSADAAHAICDMSGPWNRLADVDLQRRIIERKGEFLLFALTPPRQATLPEEARDIAHITTKRLDFLGVDGLVLYDIDDESDRNPEERPFPFLPTMDPADYLSLYLKEWNSPVVVYRAVGKYGEFELQSWLYAQEAVGFCQFSSGRPHATNPSPHP